jgi:hypothetical protein
MSAGHDVAADFQPLYGLLAEFPSADSLVAAARDLSERGYRRLDAYTPFAVHGLAEALGFHKTRMSLVVLIGGLIGMVGGFALQWWVAVKAYPLNIGGRPLNSWPAFIPVTFELTILVASLFAVLGMLALNGLPRPHHPLFAIPAFDHASSDAFFLCVEAADPLFDVAHTSDLLEHLQPKQIWHVPQSP